MKSTSPVRFPHMFIEHGIYVIYKWVVPPAARMLSSEDPDSHYHNLSSQYDSGIWNPPATTSMPLGGGGFFGGGGGGFVGPPFPASGGGIGATPVLTALPAPPKPYRYIPWEIFRDIAHALLTALWATLGGALTMYLARRNARRKIVTAAPPGNDS